MINRRKVCRPRGGLAGRREQAGAGRGPRQLLRLPGCGRPGGPPSLPDTRPDLVGPTVDPAARTVSVSSCAGCGTPPMRTRCSCQSCSAMSATRGYAGRRDVGPCCTRPHRVQASPGQGPHPRHQGRKGTDRPHGMGTGGRPAAPSRRARRRPRQPAQRQLQRRRPPRRTGPDVPAYRSTVPGDAGRCRCGPRWWRGPDPLSGATVGGARGPVQADDRLRRRRVEPAVRSPSAACPGRSSAVSSRSSSSTAR